MTPVQSWGKTFTEEEIEDPDFGQQDFDGWFCIKTDPYPCPKQGCDFVANFATVWHRVVVWEEKDDPNLLSTAQHMQGDNEQGLNRHPKVVEYEKSFGPAISYYDFVARDRRAHQ